MVKKAIFLVSAILYCFIGYSQHVQHESVSFKSYFQIMTMDSNDILNSNISGTSGNSLQKKLNSQGISLKDTHTTRQQVRVKVFMLGYHDLHGNFNLTYDPKAEDWSNVLLYGALAKGSDNTSYQVNAWENYSSLTAFCPDDDEYTCNNLDCYTFIRDGYWHQVRESLCGLLHGSPIKSSNIKDSFLRYQKVVNRNQRIYTGAGLDAMRGANKIYKVLVQIDLTEDVTIDDNISDIKIPGKGSLDLEHFDDIQIIKGINFIDVPVKIAANVTPEDMIPAENIDKMQQKFNITSTYFNSSHSKYRMIIPRSITTGQRWDPARTTAYATNIALYPLYDATNNYYYAHFVTDTENDVNLVTKLGDGTGILRESIHFCTVDDNTNYYLHKVSFSLDDADDDRVLVTNIHAKHGPFPAVQGRFEIPGPEINEINYKIYEKDDLEEDDRYLVAWHRGYWKDWPENTLQSIKASKGWDLLELDVSKTASFHNGVPKYVLFHDTFMFRESSIGPADDCVDPYDKLLVTSALLSKAQRQNLKNELKTRFPDYDDSEYDHWLKGIDQYTMTQLDDVTVRDRFGCLTDIPIPTLDDAIISAKSVALPIMIDKGEDNIDGIYWRAIEADYEDNVFFKGGPTRNVHKLTNLYGDELFTQIGYTPYVFDNTAQPDDAIDQQGNVIVLQEFLDKERRSGWRIPGVELQIKRRIEDGWNVDHGYYPDGTQRLFDFMYKIRHRKWIGITQINPTAINGFDNKIIFMDQPANPSDSNPYSSRHDRRADPDFCFYYLEADYFTTDRPDIMLLYLKAQGKIPYTEIHD